MSSPLQKLRIHTLALHKALEATAVAQALMSPALTLTRYADILAVWATGWQILERVVFAAPSAATVPHLLPTRRAQLAQADLLYLEHVLNPDRPGHARHADLCGTVAGTWGATPAKLLTNPSARSSMKLFANSPENSLANFSANLSSNLSSFIGVCYVLRGASLGGKVIARHLNDTLRLNAAHGAAFFNAESGDGLGWVQWMRSADQVLLAENDLDAACLSAGATFALLLKLFSEPQDSVTISASKLVDPAAAGADMDRL